MRTRPHSGRRPGRPAAPGAGRAARLAATAVALALLLGACAERPITLRYKFRENSVLRYRWTVKGTTVSRAPGGDAVSHRLRLVMDVTETVKRVMPGGGAVMDVALTPVVVEEDGKRGVAGPPVEIELEVSPEGQVRKVTGAASLPPEVLSALELERLLSESRPPLPERQVRIGDTWKAPLTSRGETTRIDLKGTGTFDRFESRDRKRLARVSIERKGSVRSAQEIPEGMAVLDGTSTVNSVALIGIESGELLEADSTVNSTFKLSVGEEAAPGKLTVELKTSVRKTSPKKRG